MSGYRTIVADPPWSYRNKNTGGTLKSGSAAKYETMSLSEIAGMPIQEIADRNSVLFLWVTTPLLPDGIDVMKSWGYKYKTAIYWRKIMSLGMGYWFRGQVEVCLVGIRGKVPAFRCQRANIIQSKVREHSRKPEEFWDLIAPLCPAPRIELFCRGMPHSSPHGRWEGWGHDCARDVPIPQLDDYMISLHETVEEWQMRMAQNEAYDTE